MDATNATVKIMEATDKVKEYKTKIDKAKADGIDKINKKLEALERTINNSVDKGTDWAKPKIEKLTGELQETVDGLQKRIDTLVKQVTEWYNDTILKIKKNVVKANFAKLGQECDDAMAEALAGSIPHPSIDSFIPEIKIELPDMSHLTNSGKITLPRL